MLPGEKRCPHIFSPIKIGKLWAKNLDEKTTMRLRIV